MPAGVDVPDVEFTDIDADPESVPAATLPQLLRPDSLAYDAEAQLVRLPPDEVSDGERIRYVPDELAAQLGAED